MDERIIAKQITEALAKQTAAIDRVHAALQQITTALEELAERGRWTSQVRGGKGAT